MATKQPPEAPTLAEVERFMALLGVSYKGDWQRRMMEHLCANSYAILQAPRQNAGKTWAVTTFAACALVKGCRVMIGTPALRQGERILVKRIEDMMRVIERRSGKKLRRDIDNVQTKYWSNGAGLQVVSLKEGSQAGAQGFTADILIIDEAHEVTEDTYSVVEPTLDVAAADGTARIILLGIGGNDEVTSLIEIKKFDKDGNPSPQFRSLRLTPQDIIDCNPGKYGPFYTQKEQTVPPGIWSQHYLCLPCQTGTQRVFMQLSGYIEPAWQFDAPRYEFAVDVGRTSDYTWGGVYEIRGNAINLVDYIRFTGRDWRAQAAALCPFILNYAGRSFPFEGGRRLKIETNGLGWGLIDEVRQWHDAEGGRPFHNAVGVHTNDDAPNFNKTRAMLRAMQAAYNGAQRTVGETWFGVGTNEDNPDTVARLESLRRLYLKLTYEIKERNIYEWPHSDELSSIWIQFGRVSSAFGI